MATYKIEFPNGISGKPDDLLRRVASIGGMYDVAKAEVIFEDGDKAPTADYVNAIFGEYGGTATVSGDSDSDDDDKLPKGGKG